jgi:hypothetical protein
MANYPLRLLLDCGGRWPLTEPQGCDLDPHPRRCRAAKLAAGRSGDGWGPSGCRQALTAVPRAARAPAASWSTSPGCWRAPDPFLERHGVADRCALHPGDLFAPPPAADLYLLASVPHD